MLETETRIGMFTPKTTETRAPEPKTTEIVNIDPNIQMLDVEAVARLRENGIAMGGYSQYLRVLDGLKLGTQINGAAFRRDEKLGVLFLDIFVAINPDELSRKSDYRLKGELNANPFAGPGENPFEARVSEFLGKAPDGPITGMISEVQRPRGEKPNQTRFKAR